MRGRPSCFECAGLVTAAISTAKDGSRSRPKAFLNASLSAASFRGGVWGRVRQNSAYPQEISAENRSESASRAVTLGSSGPTRKGGISWSWTPTNSLDCPTCQNPEATPTVTTTYILTVTDSLGLPRCCFRG